MNEAQRRYYLSQLGVTQYAPRWVLAGAAASVPCVLPVAEAAVDKTLDKKAPVDTQRSTTPQLRAVPEVAPTPRKSEPTIKAEPKKAEAMAKVRPVACNTWRVSESLLVIDTRQARAALPTTALLGNMVKAVGLKQPLPEVEVLKWSLHQGKVDVTHLRAMLAGYLAAQMERGRLRWVWLMGAPVAQATLSEAQWQAGGGSDLLGQRLPLDDVGAQGVEAIVLPSLASLLQEPALKATAWQAIKPFVGEF